MNDIGIRIRKIRESKGFSQKFMANQLGMTQSNYGRLEQDDGRLTVPKLTIIAKTLEVSISHILGEQATQIIHQHGNKNPGAYNVETLYQNNKELYEELKSAVVSVKEEISLLKKNHRVIPK